VGDKLCGKMKRFAKRGAKRSDRLKWTLRPSEARMEG
jgi:hypothetical protein